MKPNRFGWMHWLVAAVLGGAAVLCLATVLPDVANRQAFGWDSARRAVLNARAGDALRTGHLLDFLWYVAGPETWPTLRLVPAAFLHAVAGPHRAFAVEHALSIATVGGIVLAVAYAARALSASATGAVVVTLLATALLAGNDALLEHAANGMLEPLSAALTTAAVAAWIDARARGAARPWALAIFANLLFHTKWQHGMLFAIAVLLLEGVAPDEPRRPGNIVRAVWHAARDAVRTPWGAVLLGSTVLLGALTIAVAATGGLSVRLAGLVVSVRSVHGPLAWGALAGFLLVEGVLWRARGSLRAAVPARVRFAWSWVATPMAAWLLVPGTWRIRTILVTSATYDSGEAVRHAGARVRFYLDAAWDTWTAPTVHPVVIALVAATLVAAWRSEVVRRRLAPIVVLVAVEWLVLTFGTRHNLQARFAANLAPIVALALCAWVVALPVRWAALAGAAAVVAVAVPSSSAWSHGRLAATLAAGFDPREHATACRSLMARLPVERLPIVNHAPVSHRQGCALWAATIARQRGERSAPDGVIVVTGVGDPAPVLPGFEPAADEVVAGPLRGRVYRRP